MLQMIQTLHMEADSLQTMRKASLRAAADFFRKIMKPALRKQADSSQRTMDTALHWKTTILAIIWTLKTVKVVVLSQMNVDSLLVKIRLMINLPKIQETFSSQQ